MRHEESAVFATRAHADATAGGYALAPIDEFTSRVAPPVDYAFGTVLERGFRHGHHSKSVRAEADAVARLARTSGGSGVG